MPDWFYRTVSQPLLFRMPAAASRDLALGFLGRLARLPLGPQLIDLLGHMRADPRLARSFAGLRLPGSVALGPALDGTLAALPALARFGFGLLEVGPVTIEPTPGTRPMERWPNQQALRTPDPPASVGLDAVLPRLAEAARLGVPLAVRLACLPGSGAERAAEQLERILHAVAPHASVLTLATLRTAEASGWSAEAWSAHLRRVLEAARNAPHARPVLVCVPADLDATRAEARLEPALAGGAAGLLVDGAVHDGAGGLLLGGPALAPTRAQVRHLRERWGRELPLVAAGGVHEPLDALRLHEAGADLVQVDMGLVYGGPGLVKRINDALLHAATLRAGTPEAEPEPRAVERSWFWTLLLGLGMLVGSLLALAIAATQVVLPYDETFVGLTREQLARLNPHLLPFLTHDRVTLAGAMVALGVLYVGLSLNGIRHGLHWAQQALFVSAAVGFCSFFLFLGFGYLDPFHAFVTAVLLQFLLLGVHSRLGAPRPGVAPYLQEDRAWRRSQWGQLLVIVHACGLLGAGLAISAIGVTQVFVEEDLEFLQTTAEALHEASARLVPLVAHDRATLGGMLLSSGAGMLLTALWGFRNGSSWLWWTLLTSGVAAYAAAIGVHLAVGYTDLEHLLPAFAGLALYLAGLGLSHGYLCSTGAARKHEWQPFTPSSGD